MRKANTNESNNQIVEQEIINSLTPKIFPVEEAITKFKHYFDKLEAAIRRKDVKNIAVTGSYGAGKTTIIRNFENVVKPDKEYLYISLATFKEESHVEVLNSESGENQKELKSYDNEKVVLPKEKKESLERLIELSILQQLFFHVEPSDLPNSKLKRIKSISSKKRIRLTILSLFWLFSTTVLFKFNHFSKINPYNWSLEKDFDWLAIFLIFFFLSGLFCLVSEGVKLINSTKISRLKFLESELELGSDINKSILNEHIDEIIYFFQRTSYKVVVFEDIDRFENTEVFTKLREINLLLNNSKAITKKIGKVTFIYAVRDDKFEDQERTKFFDYIIPIIPYISPANAHQKLWKLIQNDKMDKVLTKSFIEDVLKLINNIDMRLLTNIFNEFLVYKSKLFPDDNSKGRNDNLLAMIIYKNLQPKDFARLSRQEGFIHEILNKRSTHVRELINKLEPEINELLIEVDNIESEEVEKVNELRAVYVNELRNTLNEPAEVKVNGVFYSFKQLLEDEYFNELKKQVKIEYKYYRHHSNPYYLLSENRSNISFKTIENNVNRTYSYDEREKHISDKIENKLNELKKRIENLNRKKNLIELMDLSQLYQEMNIVPDTLGLSNSRLFRYLLLNGHINEHYHHYISLFHGEDLNDFEFERKIKSGENSSFDCKLENASSLVKKLEKKYFEREVTLNHDLLNYLLSGDNASKTKLKAFLNQLSNEEKRTIHFIDSFIELESKKLENGQENNLSQFIKQLSKRWNRFWDYIYLNSNYSEEKISQYLKFIIQYSDIEDLIIFKNGSNIGTYAIQKENFLSLFDIEFYPKVKEFISTLNLKLEHLTYVDDDSQELFKYVYDNNYYEISLDNIASILEMYHLDSKVRGANGSLPENFQSNNYENILNSGCDALIKNINDNINTYVKRAYLRIEDDNTEKEEILTTNFLNHDSLKEDLKIKIIQNTRTLFKELDKIEEPSIKQQIIKLNKLFPTWANIYSYLQDYEEVYIDETLIDYYNEENNATELSKLSLDIKDDSKDDFYRQMRFALLKCNELNIESYELLLKSIPKNYKELEFEKLSDDKIQLLIDKSKLILTKENYNRLKENFADKHISLLEMEQNELVKDVFKFNLDESDLISLFKSNKFTQSNKIKLFEELVDVGESVIMDNNDLLKLTSRVIAAENYNKRIEFNLLIALIKNSTKKLELLFPQLDFLDKHQISIAFSHFNDKYSELSKPRHRPTFIKDRGNLDLMNKLVEKDVIYPFDVDAKKKKIKVVVKYD